MSEFDAIRKRLDDVSRYIRAAEEEMSCIWFEVEGDGPICWSRDQNNRLRLMVKTDDEDSGPRKPLIEATAEQRIEGIRWIVGLSGRALVAARERLSGVEDLLGWATAHEAAKKKRARSSALERS